MPDEIKPPAEATAKPEVQTKGAEAEAPATSSAAKSDAKIASETKETKAPEATATDAKVETKTETVEQKTEEKPGVPEKYELKLPKDTLLDAAYVAKVEAEAKAKGLSNDQAQAKLEEYSAMQTAFVQQQQEDFKKQQEAWVSEIETDKEIGGKAMKENIELAKRALFAFADDSFKKVLNESGLGNNPHLIRTFLRIGRRMGEDKLITTGKAGPTPKDERSRADRLYPTHNKKQE